MNSLSLKLFEARDAVDSYALAIPGDLAGNWRARSGFGGDFRNVWAVDLQSSRPPNLPSVDWNAVLERAVEAYQLSDPVIANYEWPEITPK
jgi:hypothetical protein